MVFDLIIDFEFDNMNGEKKYAGFETYKKSKLANVMFTYELAKRIEGTGITANCLHPGFVSKNFGKNNFSLVTNWMQDKHNYPEEPHGVIVKLLEPLPEDFVERMGDDEHEDNPRGLEEIFKRDVPRD